MRNDEYFTGFKGIIVDNNISSTALRVYCFVRAIQDMDGFNISCNSIAKALSRTPLTVKKAVKELEQHGYMQRSEQEFINGRFGHIKYKAF